jgi:peptidyl-prolyl cis-trans isomerase C
MQCDTMPYWLNISVISLLPQEDSMQQGRNQKQIDPMLSFHLMKFAYQDFQKSAGNLTKQEYTQAYQHANEEMLLHQVILTSDDACCVVIPEATLKGTLQGVIAEYPSNTIFHATLKENNMSLEDYTLALRNDLRVETILSQVASTVQSVTPIEILYYFNKNRTEFNQPEQRNVSYIQVLLTSSSSREVDSAFEKITAIHRRVCRAPETFSKEARLFSDCSTGKNDGNLGLLAAGDLCPELDRVLFSLHTGEISHIVESASGFNILCCNKIHPAKKVSFKEASSMIFPILLKKKQLEACRLWLQNLVQPRSS